MNHLLGSFMFDQQKGPKPEDATSVYKVCWGLYYNEPYSAMRGSDRTPQIFQNHKFFASKEKAEALKRDVDEAFKTLGYMASGYCVIQEDWYE